MLTLASAACREPPVRDVRMVGGVAAEVRAVGLRPPAAIETAFAELDRVDRLLLRGDASELARLNRAGEGTLSAELARVLEQVLDVADASGGAFQPAPTGRTPGGRDAAGVHLETATRRVRLEPGVTLELAAIARGHATDAALAALRAAGARKGLVNLGGGSVGVFGEPLTLAVADPGSAAAPRWGSFVLSDAARASLGTEDRPAPREALGVSVVARSALEAAALASAAGALGSEAGLALLARRGASGYVLLREQGRRVMRTTPGFAQQHALEAAPDVEVRP